MRPMTRSTADHPPRRIRARAAASAAVLALLVAVVGLPSAAAAMTVVDVARLLDAGVGETVILDQMEAEDAWFEITTEDLLVLRDAGASDALLREMIRRSETGGHGNATDAEDERVGGSRAYGYDPHAGLENDAYYGGNVHVRLYYDPFAYHWYAWPNAFAYYYPFYWTDCGFYYAGWWSHRWWGWGPSTAWYWDHHHWSGRHYDPRGRHAWGREPDGRRVDGNAWGRSVNASRGRAVSGRDGVVARDTRARRAEDGRIDTRDSRWGRSTAPSRPEADRGSRISRGDRGSRPDSPASRPSSPTIRSSPRPNPAPSRPAAPARPPSGESRSGDSGRSSSGRSGWSR